MPQPTVYCLLLTALLESLAARDQCWVHSVYLASRLIIGVYFVVRHDGTTTYVKVYVYVYISFAQAPHDFEA
jgi:hypothetical protein